MGITDSEWNLRSGELKQSDGSEGLTGLYTKMECSDRNGFCIERIIKED
jgi:hypothetical protein